MAAQPANTDIKVYRNVRAYRQMHRHETVAALIKRLRPLVMSIPGREILAGVITRDTTTKDFSPYMGEARHNASRGFPIVYGLFDQVSFSKAQAQLAQSTGPTPLYADFAFQIGHDKFIANTELGLSTYLHQNARDIVPDVNVGS